MTMPPDHRLDRRVTPARSHLAAVHLKGHVEAQTFVEGERARIAVAWTPMRGEPREACSLDTELLHGEAVTVYERRTGWAWVQNAADSYVGWIDEAALGRAEPPPTHRVSVVRSFRYPEAELRVPARDCLSMGAYVRVTASAQKRGTRYAVLDDGSAMIAGHLSPVDVFAADWVAVAERFLETPYLWGGRTSLGLDCSALVQLALAEAGFACPRDSDMQEAALGNALDIASGVPALRRGDLVFWKGHVAIMIDAATLLHANGHSMMVSREPASEAIARIAANSFGDVTAVRRVG